MFENSFKLISLTIFVLFVSLGFSSNLRNDHIIKLAIVGTNDIHGVAFPKHLLRSDTKQQYTRGGLPLLSTLIKTIKNQFPGQSLYLDTGDQFQGGVQSGPQGTNGTIMADYFNQIGLDASALGNHEFDFGQQFLQNYMKMKKSVSLAANIHSHQGSKNFMPNHKSSHIFTLNHGVKVGVIGLSTLQTPQSTSGFTAGKFPKYLFNQYKKTTLQQSKYLRQQGAQIIIVLAHFGNKCPMNKTYDIRTNQTDSQPCQNDQITQYIDSLPQGTIDGILCGHRHQFAHHWHRNVPFMGSVDGGYYFNIMYFYFDTIQRKIVKTQIQGPIPVCQKVFSNKKSCEFLTQQQLIQAGPLTSWTFHDKQVKMDQSLLNLFSVNYQPIVKKFQTKLVLNNVKQKMTRVRDRQNFGGRIISTLLARAASRVTGLKIDFSIVNHGLFRSTWFPGAIYDSDFYDMFPFQDGINVFQMKGADVKQLFKRIQSGKGAFYYAHGVHQNLTMRKSINKNDHSDFKIQKALVDIKLQNGQQIQDQKLYRGVLMDFLLNGGDDFNRAFKMAINPETKTPFIPLQIINKTKIGQMRENIHYQLKLLKQINPQWSSQSVEGKLTKRMNITILQDHYF